MDFRRRSPVTWPSVGAAGGSGGAIRRQSHCEDEAKNKKIKKICSYALARTKAAAAQLSKKCSRTSGPNDNVANNRCTLESRNNKKNKSSTKNEAGKE